MSKNQELRNKAQEISTITTLFLLSYVQDFVSQETKRKRGLKRICFRTEQKRKGTFGKNYKSLKL
jgi:hypothetical protein